MRDFSKVRRRNSEEINFMFQKEIYNIRDNNIPEAVGQESGQGKAKNQQNENQANGKSTQQHNEGKRWERRCPKHLRPTGKGQATSFTKRWQWQRKGHLKQKKLCKDNIQELLKWMKNNKSEIKESWTKKTGKCGGADTCQPDCLDLLEIKS